MPVISLAAADSGISTMQTEIDTIGNNVANSDSDGYQEADVQFSDILTQELAPGSGASTGLASTDPATVGAGAQVAAMQTNFSQGAIEAETPRPGIPITAIRKENGRPTGGRQWRSKCAAGTVDCCVGNAVCSITWGGEDVGEIIPYIRLCQCGGGAFATGYRAAARAAISIHIEDGAG